LLRERISLRGMCRAVGGGLTWLLGFLVHCFEALPAHLPVEPIACTPDGIMQRLEVKADALGSFSKKQANTQGMFTHGEVSRKILRYLQRAADPPPTALPEAFPAGST